VLVDIPSQFNEEVGPGNCSLPEQVAAVSWGASVLVQEVGEFTFVVFRFFRSDCPINLFFQIV